MRYPRQAWRSLAAALPALAALALTTTPARGQQSSYFDGEAAMTGASGMAQTRTAGATWYNPAGLAAVQRKRLDLSGTVFVLRLQPMPGALTVELPSGVYDGDLEAKQLLPLPAALVFSRGIRRDVTLAFGIFVTELGSHRLSSTLRRDEIDPDSGLPFHYTQRSAVDHFVQTYHIGPAVGWQVTPRLRLGWSLFVVYSSWRDIFGFNLEAHGTESADPEFRVQATEDVRIDGWSIAAQAVMGLQWEVATHWHLGVVARTPVMAFWQSQQTSSLSSALFASQSEPDTGSFRLEEPEDRGAGFRLVDPAVISVGFAYRNPRFWVGLEADFLPPLKTPSLGVETTFQWNLRLGGRVRFNRKWSAGLGAFTDRAAKTIGSFPTESRMHDYGFATGLEWRSTYGVKGSDRPDGLVFSTTVGFRYAIGLGDVVGFHFSTQGTPIGFSLAEATFHEIGLYIGSSLLF